MKIKGEGREKKWKKNRSQRVMPVHGASVKVIERITQERADRIEKKRND